MLNIKELEQIVERILSGTQTILPDPLLIKTGKLKHRKKRNGNQEKKKFLKNCITL